MTWTVIFSVDVEVFEAEDSLDAFVTEDSEKTVAGVELALVRSACGRVDAEVGMLADGTVIPGERAAPIVNVGGPDGTSLTTSTDRTGLFDPVEKSVGMLTTGLVVVAATGGLLGVIR